MAQTQNEMQDMGWLAKLSSEEFSTLLERLEVLANKQLAIQKKLMKAMKEMMDD